jgi:hypothetical protein
VFSFGDAGFKGGVEGVAAEESDKFGLGGVPRGRAVATVGVTDRFETRDATDRFTGARFDVIDIVVVDEAEIWWGGVVAGGVCDGFCRYVRFGSGRCDIGEWVAELTASSWRRSVCRHFESTVMAAAIFHFVRMREH